MGWVRSTKTKKILSISLIMKKILAYLPSKNNKSNLNAKRII